MATALSDTSAHIRCVASPPRCEDLMNPSETWCGVQAGKDGTYVGIELDNPEGRMNGTIKENTYFATKPQHGASVPQVPTVFQATDS